MSNSLIKNTDNGVATKAREGSMVLRTPSVDIGETSNEYVVVMNLPGLVAEDIDITFGNERLDIHGHSSNKMREDITCLRGERKVADFKRTIDLQGCLLDSQGITADYQLGVLTIRLPKSELAKVRRIEVK